MPLVLLSPFISALLLFQIIPVRSRDNDLTHRPTPSITSACVVMANFAVDNSIIHISGFILGGVTIAQLTMLLIILLVVLPINRTIYMVTAITPAGPAKASLILCRFLLPLTQPLRG